MKFKCNVIEPEFQPVELVVVIESQRELDNLICGVPNKTHEVMAEGMVRKAKEHWSSLTKMMGGRDVPNS
jgi:uncharacterized protein YifN (PemK superfamily)